MTAAAAMILRCGASPRYARPPAGGSTSPRLASSRSRRGVGHDELGLRRRNRGALDLSTDRTTNMISRFPGHRKLAAVAAAALLAAGAGACSSSSSPGSSGSKSSSSSGTLIMESSPESTITQAFNPFVPTQAIFGMGADGLIYEPLIQFDIAAPPKYYPWLATSYQWSNGGKTVSFTIRQGVKFSNGTPMTPADVAFTYNLVKANKA